MACTVVTVGYEEENGRLEPAREQIERLFMYIMQEPKFGIELADDEEWEELLTLLHSEREHPQFKRCEWERFWIKEVQAMLKKLDSCGKGLLDYYSLLVYQAHAACKSFAEKTSKDCQSGKGKYSKDESDSDEASVVGGGIGKDESSKEGNSSGDGTDSEEDSDVPTMVDRKPAKSRNILSKDAGLQKGTHASGQQE
ncbi:hypothetical protein QAD02_011961 [Eretmocerus hayati]|uniref:Uncharacterized protein n=1 Tax=Eretmocerus hayati TaxID=131215 RepID=A0ACC2NYA6_9HYME|nr:hypothetical protein QAD02_011961 [Eretmocerus hayati]